ADAAPPAKDAREGHARLPRGGAAGAPGGRRGRARGTRGARRREGRHRRVPGQRAEAGVTRSPVMTAGQRRRLTVVARGEAPADLYVRGGTLLNVYTGELYRANVAVAGERIAYVGERDDMVGP